MKKQTTYILVAALIVLQLYSITRINSLQSRVENLNNNVHSVENRLDNQISSIYQNVDQQLEAQASLILNSSTKVGKLNIATLTVPVTFTVEPKVITETMSVSLDFNGELVQLEQSGLQYSTTKNLKISDSISPKIVIEDKGVKNIEDPMELRVSNIKEQVFPHIYAHFSGGSSYGSNEYSTKGQLGIDYKPSQDNHHFIDMKYVIRVDDETIKETPIAMDTDSGLGRPFTLDILDKYSINDGQTLTSTVVAVDSLGFTHEYLVTHFVAGSDRQREPYFEQEKIIAPNGEPVYLFDENNYEKIN